ncbi:MAG: hypothetical protein ACYC35_09795 [Pirellulales bacterium]
MKRHEVDFLDAIRTGGRSSADFDYSARFVEIMLVGNVASLVREKLTYDFLGEISTQNIRGPFRARAPIPHVGGWGLTSPGRLLKLRAAPAD